MIAIELGLRLGDRVAAAPTIRCARCRPSTEVTDLLAASVASFAEVTSAALEGATDGIVLAHEPADLPAVSFTATPGTAMTIDSW